MRFERALLAGVSLSLAGVIAAACGGGGTGRSADDFSDAGGGGGDSPDATTPTFAGIEAGPGFGDASSAKCKTTISGTVYDPAGKSPLYNVVVYAPTTGLDPIKQGVSCDKCGSSTSGRPSTSALSDAKGNFKLENAPSGKNVPLVVQVGKWRRQIKVPNVKECEDNKIDDPDLFRLPKNHTEGDMPNIGLVTGSLDAMECLLTKIGIDGSEFSNKNGNGKIHVFKQDGGATTKDGATPAATLWHNATELKKYDLVMFACDGSPIYSDSISSSEAAESARNIFDYLNEGGRVFGTHYHYFWFKFAPSPMNTTASYGDGKGDPATPKTYSIDTSFPKGKAFSDWLDGVGASSGKAKIALASSDVRNSIASINTSAGVQRWIYNANFPKYITFNAPVGVTPDKQCGRAVFSDLHVSPGDIFGGSSGTSIPDTCSGGPLTPQEQALEFLFFDLSSCVQDDSTPPVAPH